MNNPFLYQYPVPPPPPYPHPVSKGVLGAFWQVNIRLIEACGDGLSGRANSGPDISVGLMLQKHAVKHWTVAASGGETFGAAAVS